MKLPAAFVSLALASSVSAGQFLLYVGTYTGAKSEGIYAYRFDSGTGEVSELGLAAKATNPTFLAVHPNGRFVYAANETGKWGDQPGGYVSAFRVDSATGRLIELNQQSSVGGGPCHLNVDATGKNVLVANYGGGSVACLPLNVDGSLKPHSAFVQHVGSSVNPARQKEPHGHSVNLSPDNRFAFVADLGTDKIHTYAFDAVAGSLTARPELDVVLPPGSGPRHFAFGPKGAKAYVINELLQTVTAFRYAPKTGKLTAVDTVSTLPDAKPVPGNSTAEVRVHPNGKFVYGSNRGHDSIAVFAVGKGGKLSAVQHVPVGGKTPRNFNFDPSGRFLFAGHQGSNSFSVFTVDGKTGQLSATGKTFKVGSPVCFRFVPVP
jgi:6-phosphogluconolactonase